MTSNEFSSMLEEMARGWSTRDYKNVAAKFAGKLFYSDGLNYTFRDNASLLRFFEDDDAKPQSCKFHNAIFDESRQLGCAEYTYKGTHIYHGTVWIKFDDNKIIDWREYQYRTNEDRTEFWKR